MPPRDEPELLLPEGSDKVLKRLMRHRPGSALTRKSLAERWGRSLATLSRWFVGGHTPMPLRCFEDLAARLLLSPDALRAELGMLPQRPEQVAPAGAAAWADRLLDETLAGWDAFVYERLAHTQAWPDDVKERAFGVIAAYHYWREAHGYPPRPSAPSAAAFTAKTLPPPPPDGAGEASQADGSVPDPERAP